MKKIVVFDFNRTLYDPDTSQLFPDSLETLSLLQKADVELHLLSRREAGRDDTVRKHELESFFTRVNFVEGGKLRTLVSLSEEFKSNLCDIYVVGDHLHEEIRGGNHAGFKTIWLKRGKLSYLTAQSNEDMPWRTIQNLRDVLPIILNP